MAYVRTCALVSLVALAGCQQTSTTQQSLASMDQRVDAQLIKEARNACLRDRLPQNGGIVYAPGYQHPFAYCTNMARAKVLQR